MPQTDNSSYRIAWLKSITEVDQTHWDILAEPLRTPFLEWEWLRQMEVSKSTTAETGWLPYHLTVWSQDQLVAAAPLYIKGHSAGEFVFDKILKNELWKARFQLVSRSWYYDPNPAMKALAIIPKETIPNFKYVIDWYKNYATLGQ